MPWEMIGDDKPEGASAAMIRQPPDGDVRRVRVAERGKDGGATRSSRLAGGEGADGDVVSVRVPKRELARSRVRVHVRLFLEPGGERARPLQCQLEIVDAEEQEQPVAGRRLVRAPQRRMLVRAPLVEAEQDGSIPVHDLPEVV